MAQPFNNVPLKDIPQEGAAWLTWRRGGLGSSDAPIINRAVKWCTPLKLWEIKMGLREEDPPNWPMKRGKLNEPRARAAFELEFGREMPAACVELAKYPFVRASLDGWDRDSNEILEIKIPGKVDHALAQQGQIPLKYQYQLLHQMLCTGAELAHYWSYHPETKTGFYVPFKKDKAREAALFAVESEFWDLVQTKTKPAGIRWWGEI